MSKQISFANTLIVDKAAESGKITRGEITPILHKPEESLISIDERSRNDGSELLQIPEYKPSGTFIRQGHSPINRYELRNLEPPKVPEYRVFTGHNMGESKQDRPYASKIQSSYNEPKITT